MLAQRNLGSSVKRDPTVVLGYTQQGRVILGQYNGKIPVAIKQSYNSDYGRMRRELENWMKMVHPNILPIYGYIDDNHNPNQGSLDLVTPYVPEGTLADCCTKNSNMSEQTKRGLVFDVAFGLAFLHKNDTVHLDVKASNVLVTNVHTGTGSFQLRALLCDFGYAKEQNGLVTSSSLSKGSLPWQAWELHAMRKAREYYPSMRHRAMRRKLLHKADVWSWGMLIVEVYTGRFPYAGMKIDAIKGLLEEGQPPPFDRRVVDPYLSVHLNDCWEKDPATRPSMQKILDKAGQRPSHRNRVRQSDMPDRPPSDNTSTMSGKNVLFYVRAKRPSHADLARARKIITYHGDEALLPLGKGDIVAVEHQYPDGWCYGQQLFPKGAQKALFKENVLRDPEPPRAKLQRDMVPFVGQIKRYWSGVTNREVPEGTPVLIKKYPDDRKDSKQRLEGHWLIPGLRGFFPCQCARKILGPGEERLWRGEQNIQYFVQVTKPYAGAETQDIDGKDELRFSAGDVIAVTDAPDSAEAPWWTGEVVTSYGRLSCPGLFAADAVEFGYLGS